MKKRGIASLPVILLLGGIIIEIGVAGAFLLVYLNNSLYGTRLANEALEAAHSGVNDAMMRIIVDKNTNTSPDSYYLTVGGRTANVTICKDCSDVGTGKTKVTAVGQALTKQHRLVAILNVDPDTGVVSIVSVSEVTQ